MSPTTTSAPLIFLIAGEPSGDLLGGRLMAALRRETGGRVRFAGIGGENMAAEGLVTLFPLEDLAVMGFLEVLPRLPRILRRLRETVTAIRSLRPQAVVSIDSWGFTGRVNRALREERNSGGWSVPQIHYVAPMVWAWRPRRAFHLAACLDHLMTLLPNEPPYFLAAGLPTTHVGHPVIETGERQADGAAFRVRHGIGASSPILCFLPGSRRNEVTRLLPIFEQCALLLRERYPGLHIIVPTVANVAEIVSDHVWRWPVPATVVRGAEEKFDAFAAADVALAASGTVALELAQAGLPNVIAYRASPVSVWLFRRLTTLKYVNLVNLLVDRLVVAEFLQADCQPGRLAEALSVLLDDPATREKQREGMAEAMTRLGGGEEAPSTRAARVVLEIMASRSCSTVGR
ncbi:MAG: lipid-A-disaccharide synthase [Alphaproteobacteria bacterium]